MSNPALVFNSSVYLALALLPLLALLAAINYDFGRINSLVFVVLSTSYIFIGPPKYWIQYGMYGFILSIFLSFYVSSLFYRYLNTKSKSVLIKLTLFGSLTFFVHPLSLFICLGLCGPIYIYSFSKFDSKDYARLFFCSLIILLVNLPWILPSIHFSDFIVTQFIYFQTHMGLFLKPSAILSFILFLFFLYQVYQGRRIQFFKNCFPFMPAVFCHCLFLALNYFLNWYMSRQGSLGR